MQIEEDSYTGNFKWAICELCGMIFNFLPVEHKCNYMSENQKQSVEGWEKKFDENVDYDSEELGCNWGKDKLKEFIRQLLSQQQLEVVEKIEKIDFFGWHKDTQRLIKDKILQSLSTLTTLNNK